MEQTIDPLAGTLAGGVGWLHRVYHSLVAHIEKRVAPSLNQIGLGI